MTIFFTNGKEISENQKFFILQGFEKIKKLKNEIDKQTRPTD